MKSVSKITISAALADTLKDCDEYALSGNYTGIEVYLNNLVNPITESSLSK